MELSCNNGLCLSPCQRKALATLMLLRRRRLRASKRVWVRESNLHRPELGEFRLLRELQYDDDRFQSYLKLSRDQFLWLLKRVAPFITKLTTNRRKPISAPERLAICLRYLVTGDPYVKIAGNFRVGSSTVSQIILSVSEAIWQSMAKEFLPLPGTAEDWLKIARGFRDVWNFPNCLGALVVKRIVAQQTATTVSAANANAGKAKKGSKSHHQQLASSSSTVMVALVDASHRVRMLETCRLERGGSLITGSIIGRALSEGRALLNLPDPEALPGLAGSLGPTPYVFLGDKAFPLSVNILQPYSGHSLTESQIVFNNRLAETRRVVDSTLDILADQWKVYRREAGVRLQNVDTCVKATVVLHNFLRGEDASLAPPPPAPPQQLDSSAETPGCPLLEDLKGIYYFDDAPQEALDVREKFKLHFHPSPDHYQLITCWQTD